jgi:hypothetical protein
MAIVLTFAPRPCLIRSSDRLLFDQVITMATVTIEVPDEVFAAPFWCVLVGSERVPF